MCQPALLYGERKRRAGTDGKREKKEGLYFHATQLYSRQIRTANQIRRSYKIKYSRDRFIA